MKPAKMSKSDGGIYELQCPPCKECGIETHSPSGWTFLADGTAICNKCKK